MIFFSVVQLIAGLILFLGGLQAVKDSFYQAAGDKLTTIIRLLTTNVITGILTGMVVTMLIQSSSATTVIIISLVNAEVLSLRKALGVIMGANIGTTVTVQLISFSLGQYIGWIIIASLIINIIYWLTKQRLLKYLGRGLLGFSILWIGLEMLSNIMTYWQDVEWFIDFLAQLSSNPLLGLLLGILVTATIQSSSALTGLVVALAKVNLIGLPAAISLTLGSNIGTCITAFLAAMGSSLAAKRTAIMHLLFNMLGAIVWLPLLPIFTRVVLLTSEQLTRQIANAHTIFNLVNTGLILGVRDQFVALVVKVTKNRE
ncbi:Na/Pi-cotransporter [Halobacteroides halobius DSM 5150]|uniref:Na/Pi-cotransporter n=1 Tax=Halobacteroides halobius (strain ATCC 35273 / DSM 5150 / MD-1) TaxID=748449 RepID=L0K6Q2_HALHC|nr:Na/Pi symporter [Halobacteroides halobius]AGB40706.1 Na/Pi-cotransporter [Halobacteroides halobius DSM 5150]